MPAVAAPSIAIAWSALMIAAVFEVGFTTALRLSDGFKNIGWSAAFGVSAFLSFWFLAYAQRAIPLGTAYAVWTGIGAVGTLIVGILFFREPATAIRLALIVGIVACVAGLKLASPA